MTRTGFRKTAIGSSLGTAEAVLETEASRASCNQTELTALNPASGDGAPTSNGRRAAALFKLKPVEAKDAAKSGVREGA